MMIMVLQGFGQTDTIAKKQVKMKNNFALAIHGGAGNLQKRNLTPEQEEAYKRVMAECLQLGNKMLERGDSAVNVVEAVIKIMEDSPLFNAGKGSVFSHDGTNEMDAAMMDGKTLKCGAATLLRTVKNPISLAKSIMQKSKFVFLNGKGAEKYAKEHGLEIVDTSYFFDKMRWDQYLKIRDSSKTQLDNEGQGYVQPLDSVDKFGTVGCVVLDRYGNLAAGTSTGGIVNKNYNRIGDSPVIGAGTYANNSTCAISCTGHGEDFIRLVAAHEVSSLVKYKPMSLKKAADQVIHKQLSKIGGRGGLIAINRRGQVVFSFNTSGMYRGYMKSNGKMEVKIYKD